MNFDLVVCVYMYVEIYASNMCVYVCMRVCVYMCVCTCVCIWACAAEYTFVSVCDEIMYVPMCVGG